MLAISPIALHSVGLSKESGVPLEASENSLTPEEKPHYQPPRVEESGDDIVEIVR